MNDSDDLFGSVYPGRTPDPASVSEQRKASVRATLARMTEEKARKEAKPKRASGPEYTTDYAISWGKAKGWKVIQRERWGASHVRGKIVYRREDCAVGSDVLFSDGGSLVLCQAAGSGERMEHYKRFLNRGGVDACEKFGARFVYVEFTRESETPIKEEWWA